MYRIGQAHHNGMKLSRPERLEKFKTNSVLLDRITDQEKGENTNKFTLKTIMRSADETKY